ncbi:MAG: TIM barrel protein [Bryobacteraceae bacterium]
MTRRQLLLMGSAGVLLAATNEASRLSVEAYIFQQYASRQGKPLAAVLDEVFAMARNAGFTNIELNQEFFTPALRDRTLALVRSNHLRMPSVYVGGAMHEKTQADQTIQRALEIAGICKPFGCIGVVHNPDPKPAHAEKSDEELTIQAESLNRMGRALARNGFQLRVHHHTPELVDNAREWRQILRNTDGQYVSLCEDLDWSHQGGFDPLAMLKEEGARVTEIHVRSSKDKLWLESLQDGDIDYSRVAAFLNKTGWRPLIVVELAYREDTVVTRPLGEDLRLSRIYAERVFGVKA